ncbi:MAG TPA: hypothetical protein DGG94_05400 [Micromonosporaceae bacterium]|nr:hypothetical protein [Micromonosporaceae bacterium]
MKIAVSGHRGLASDVEQLVGQAIRDQLGQFRADLTGYSCLADGADQIFARAILDLGGRLDVMIPARTYRDSLPTHAHRGYDELVERATAIHRLDHEESTPESHMSASIEMLKHAEHLFAVWDGRPARSYGGTADVVSHAYSIGLPVTVIWPPGARRD